MMPCSYQYCRAVPKQGRLQFAWRDVRGRCDGRGALGPPGRSAHSMAHAVAGMTFDQIEMDVVLVIAV